MQGGGDIKTSERGELQIAILSFVYVGENGGLNQPQFSEFGWNGKLWFVSNCMRNIPSPRARAKGKKCEGWRPKHMIIPIQNFSWECVVARLTIIIVASFSCLKFAVRLMVKSVSDLLSWISPDPQCCGFAYKILNHIIVSACIICLFPRFFKKKLERTKISHKQNNMLWHLNPTYMEAMFLILKLWF